LGEAFEKRYVEMLQQSEAKEFRIFVGSPIVVENLLQAFKGIVGF